MRVIAGKARRILLRTPKNFRTRPTSDRTKETLFNVLQPIIYDCSFLDLFSGSGGIGIEALSRGAKECVFVETDYEATECIRDNLEKTKMTKEAQVIKRDALTALRQLEGQMVFDCIFMDPPYGKDLESEVLNYLAKSKLLASDGWIVIEASNDTKFDYLAEIGYSLVKEKQYKTNKHLFIERKEG